MDKLLTLVFVVAIAAFCLLMAAYSTGGQLGTRSASIKIIDAPDLSSIRLESLTVSPDGRRIAYAVQEGESLYMIVDGNKEGPYVGLVGETWVFSPDSKRFAYAAVKKGGKRVAVVDGKEFGGEFDSLP